MNIEEVCNDLQEIMTECSIADWNGYHADPVNILSCVRAAFFAGSLKGKSIGCPDIAVESDGTVCLVWARAGGRLLISFELDGAISFVCVGDICCNGTFKLGDKIPKLVQNFFNAYEGNNDVGQKN